MLARNRFLFLGGMLVLLAAASVHAQDGAAQGARAVVLYGHGGGFSPLADLNDSGSADFKTGWDAGGGIGVQLNKYVALRGNFTFARARARGAVDFGGAQFNRFFYDADVQLRYPFAGGVAPYVFAGGGGVTIDQSAGGASPSFTKGAGKVGVGLSYRIPRSSFGLYAESSGWLYKWDRIGLDKTQFDSTWSGGISYRLPF